MLSLEISRRLSPFKLALSPGRLVVFASSRLGCSSNRRTGVKQASLLTLFCSGAAPKTRIQRQASGFQGRSGYGKCRLRCRLVEKSSLDWKTLPSQPAMDGVASANRPRSISHTVAGRPEESWESRRAYMGDSWERLQPLGEPVI